MEYIDQFDKSKFKFEYLKDREIGRFFITDKEGNTNIFDVPFFVLVELDNEIQDAIDGKL